jgi:hypothetical protein
MAKAEGMQYAILITEILNLAYDRYGLPIEEKVPEAVAAAGK